MSRSITILGVTMILAMVQNTEARHVRHGHHHGKGNTQEISRDHAVSSQIRTVELNTTQLFGLHVNGPIAITKNERNKLKKKLMKAYEDINCKLALKEDGCNHAILIARHNGNFQNNYDYHYNGLSYNSVTNRGPSLGNNIDSTSRSRRSTDAPCVPTKFQCSLPDQEEKNLIKQKCWLFDFYVETHTSSLHNMEVQGAELMWSDISKYMGKVGKKLLSVKTDDPATFFNKTYKEIDRCHIGDISDSNIKSVNGYYKNYTDLIQKMHVNFHHLKHAEDNEGNKQDCFQVLLDFMNYLSEIQAANNAANNAEDNENWEDIMLSKNNNLIDKFTTSMYEPNQKVHFCHQKILVEYSTFIYDRAVMKDTLLENIESYCELRPGVCGDYSENSLKASLDSGVLYNMRKIFPKMSSLLYKTLLMSDPQGRVLDNATENQLVYNHTKDVEKKFEDIDMIENYPEDYWRKKVKAAKRAVKIAAKKMRKQQA